MICITREAFINLSLIIFLKSSPVLIEKASMVVQKIFSGLILRDRNNILSQKNFTISESLLE